MKKAWITVLVIIVLLIIAGGLYTEYYSINKKTRAPSTSDNQTTTSMDNNENASGEAKVRVEDVKEGMGTDVKMGDTVSILYTGTLPDGTVFDSSAKHGGAPLVFTIGAGQVISGFEQGVLGMKVGGERKVTIPSELGYGANGIPGVIPPNSTLVFMITLEKIG